MPDDSNTNRVTTREWDWAQLVRDRAGKDYTRPEPGYEFTGRKFDSPTTGGAQTPEDV